MFERKQVLLAFFSLLEIFQRKLIFENFFCRKRIPRELFKRKQTSREVLQKKKLSFLKKTKFRRKFQKTTNTLETNSLRKLLQKDFLFITNSEKSSLENKLFDGFFFIENRLLKRFSIENKPFEKFFFFIENKIFEKFFY